jgi:hypothetical protein
MTEAASQAVYGKGTILEMDTHEIAEIRDFGDLKPKRETKDVTHHNSPGDHKEWLKGLIDSGVLTIAGNLRTDDTDGQMALWSAFLLGDVHAFVMTFPDGAGTWTFNAIVEEFGTKQPRDDALGFSASLKITAGAALAASISAGLTTPFLSASTGTLFPAAAQATLLYVLPVITGTTSITLTPTAAGSGAVIKITANGATQIVTSGAASTAIALGAAGTITEIEISVTETGKGPKYYKVLVERAAA